MDRNELLKFLRGRRLGVLATVSASQKPEAAVVGIAVTDDLELIFDTLSDTRKVLNLRENANIAFVVGWDNETSVQYEGVADEPKGAELERIKEVYFEAFPDGREREKWDGITYFRVRPKWAKFSDFNDPPRFVEFMERDLNGR